MNIEVFEADSDGEGMRIGVVQARFNDAICEALRSACLEGLLEGGVAEEDIFVCTVPGALEIPFALEQLALSGEFDALIAIGSVVRGETYHFEIVSNESAAGITRVGLDYSIPIANAILTTEDEGQAFARAAEKGGDAARVAIEMANLADSLSELSAPLEDLP